MKVAVVPANTRTTSAAIRSLLAQDTPAEVTGWYRDTSKAPEEFTSHSNFKVVQGDVLDGASLDFAGYDVVLAVPPPFFANKDMISITEKLSHNIKDALERSGTVKRLVLLSSIGAHLYEGVGEIQTKTLAERILKQAKIPSISIIRPAWFMDNWAQQVPTLKEAEPSMLSYLPVQSKLAMVAIKDVGDFAAKEATTDLEQAKPLSVYELQGPNKDGYSPAQIRDIFSQSLGKDVKLNEIKQSEIHGFFTSVLPPGCADYIVDMVTCLLPDGIVTKNPDPEAVFVHGPTSLETTIGEIALAAK